MKSHSERDVWQEVRKAERLHGDQAEVRLAQRIDELIKTKHFEEASFWSAVADRLKDLHAIKLPGSSVLPALMTPTHSGRTT